MFARLLILLATFVFAPAALATPIDCQKSPTFLRKVPGGHEVVFYCGCEPPSLKKSLSDASACGYPENQLKADARLSPRDTPRPFSLSPTGESEAFVAIRRQKIDFGVDGQPACTDASCADLESEQTSNAQVAQPLLPPSHPAPTVAAPSASYMPRTGAPWPEPAVVRPCVGVCYGVASTVTGNPRNNYVRGYFRKNGTYVQPYTRSSRSRRR